jgi:mRNA deadenylase 3'-5' endonuclease subunit Ccr4
MKIGVWNVRGLCGKEEGLKTENVDKEIHKMTWNAQGYRSIIDYIFTNKKLSPSVQNTKVYRGYEVATDHYLLPYFPVDNAHPIFSVLTNFLNRYRAPENTWNRMTGCGQACI